MLLLKDYLSELTGNLSPDEHIMEFVSLGPKSYGYLQSGGKCLEFKCTALNATNRENTNFDALRVLCWTVSNPAGDELMKSMIEQCSIIRIEKKWATETRTLQKM